MAFHSSPATPLRSARRQGHRALRYARALLAQPDPDRELVAVVLTEALLKSDLGKREEAARRLAAIGATALPALFHAWQWAEGDGRKAILTTWSLMGPDAVPAVPILKVACDEEYLGPYALAALACIQPSPLANVLKTARSPYTWTGALDLILVVLSHPITTWLSILSTLLSLLHWYCNLSSSPEHIATSISASFALLGASLGALIAMRLGDWSKASTAAKWWGTAGSVAGMSIGSVAAAVVLPLLRALTPVG